MTAHPTFPSRPGNDAVQRLGDPALSAVKAALNEDLGRLVLQAIGLERR